MITPASMVSNVKYEVLEHTADVGLRVYGTTLEQLFEHAALGMFDLMTDVDVVKARGEVEIRVEAPDIESLLVDWLTELLYIHEVENVFLSRFEVSIEDLSLKATARGESVDPSRHPLELLIKAVTFHMIEVNAKEGYAVVIFDV